MAGLRQAHTCVAPLVAGPPQQTLLQASRGVISQRTHADASSAYVRTWTPSRRTSGMHAAGSRCTCMTSFCSSLCLSSLDMSKSGRTDCGTCNLTPHGTIGYKLKWQWVESTGVFLLGWPILAVNSMYTAQLLCCRAVATQCAIHLERFGQFRCRM